MILDSFAGGGGASLGIQKATPTFTPSPLFEAAE